MKLRRHLQRGILLMLLAAISSTTAGAVPLSHLVHVMDLQDMDIEMIEGSAERVSLWATWFHPGSPQTHESSCGPAALTNLLRIFFDVAIDEASIIQDEPEHGRGSTLYRLLATAKSLGFEASAYRMHADLLFQVLDEIGIPVIGVLAEPVGHFIIAVAQASDGLLIFDPAVGFTVIPKRQLSERWSGYALVVDPGSERIARCRAITVSMVDRSKARRELLSRLHWITP